MPSIWPSLREFATEIRRCLIHAYDDDSLGTSPNEIFNKLRFMEHPQPDGSVVATVLGGPFRDSDTQTQPFISRADGAILSFTVVARYGRGGDLEDASGRFHMKFREDSSPPFVRIDINSKAQSGEPLVEPRFHVHPGDKEIRIPLPSMTPCEILFKLLSGTPHPGEPRRRPKMAPSGANVRSPVSQQRPRKVRRKRR